MNLYIHFFGCSLTYCEEISGQHTRDPIVSDLEYMWPVVLGKRLGYAADNIKIWARPAISCKDIALLAIDAMHKHDGIFVVCWTWPERTPYWNNLDSIDIDQSTLTVSSVFFNGDMDKNHPVMKRPELLNHFIKYEGNKNWVINYLIHFNLVNETAAALNKKCIHIQMGDSIINLNESNWFAKQTIPSMQFSRSAAPYEQTCNPYLMYPPALVDHSLYKLWESADILFREPSLYRYIEQLTDRSSEYYCGFHWSKQGCTLVADVLYNTLITSHI